MNDYISRQAVLDLIYELQNLYENEGKESEDFNSKMMYVGSVNALTAMEDGLSDIPPADVRPVVRCRDCKHYVKGSCNAHSVWPDEYSPGYDCRPDDDDFCSYGERKEG